eukprot:gb/GECG01007380.1/.p1 GENE.gb/GECG01007380.1/~~gb/GECG01007380.1/.p1  ORF type:complete len:544 (+),score=72.54 gb/GECG01007380.1/:1-1632(+)
MKKNDAKTSREGLSDDEVKALPTLEYTLFKTFGVFVSISMILICAILITSIVVTGNATESISEDGLNDQIDVHLTSSAVELSAKVGLRLKTIEDSVVKFSAGIHSEAYLGKDVLEVPEPDFRNTDSELADEVGPIDRFGDVDEEGTLENSVWFFNGNQGTPDTDNIRNSSSKMHYFYRSLWRNHESVIAMYTGYQENQLYRYYPGRVQFDNGFNPLVRDWYIAARDAEGDDVGHDGPYVDAFGHGWMITISKAFCANSARTSAVECETNDNNLVGVAAADITIGALQKEILKVQFFDENTATMVRYSDGAVVASQHWDSEATETDQNAEPPFIYDLEGSGIDQSQWQEIRDASEGAKVIRYTKTDGTKWVLARSFVPLHESDRPGESDSSTGNSKPPRYVIFVEAEEDTVKAPLEDMKDEIDSSKRNLIIIAVFLSLAVWVLVLGLIKFTAFKITGPLRKMMEVATVITSEAANDTGMEGELSTDIPEPNDEIGEFVREFQTMVHGLNKGGVKGTKVHDYVQNPFYREQGSTQPLPWSSALSK